MEKVSVVENRLKVSHTVEVEEFFSIDNLLEKKQAILSAKEAYLQSIADLDTDLLDIEDKLKQAEDAGIKTQEELVAKESIEINSESIDLIGI